MSSQEEFEESEPDFSASEEDEWLPEKEYGKKRPKTSSENDTSDDMIDEEDEKPDKLRKKIITKSNTYRQRQHNKHTRTSTVTSATQIKPEINTNLMTILESSQFKKKKLPAKSNNDESDSDSSGDDHLIHPDNLDLTSYFFQKDDKQEKLFNFDCNAGVGLSDSSDEDFKGFSEQPSTSQSESNKSLIKKLNEKSAVNFELLGAFSKNLESAKQKFIDFKATKSDNNVDIGSLLAMGEKEPTKKDKKGKKTKAKIKESSESDWEEVEDSQSTQALAKDIEITISQDTGGKKKKEIDVETLIRREINKVKRENQIYLHKTSIICLVAHGNYINNILNDSKLMELALKLLPSQTCYPKERTNLNYFGLIATNFCRIVQIENQSFHSAVKGSNLMSSLQIQLVKKKAICKRDFILQFIILLRAIGIHSRLVMALPVLPKKLPQSELCTVVLKKNPTEDDEKDDKKVKKRKSDGSLVLPQLDGNDDSVPFGSKKVKLSGSFDGKSNKEGSKKVKSSPEKVKRNSSSSSLNAETELKSSSSNKASSRTQRNKLDLKSLIEKSDAARNKLKAKSENVSKSQLRTTRSSEANSSSKTLREKLNFKSLTENSNVVQQNAKLSPSTSKSLPKKSPTQKQEATRSRKKSNKQEIDHTYNIQSSSDKSVKSSKKHQNTKTTSTSQHKNLESNKNQKSSSFDSKKLNKLQPQDPKLPKSSKKSADRKMFKNVLDNRVLSTDEEDNSPSTSKQTNSKKSKIGLYLWVEVFSEEEEKWVSIDVLKSKVHDHEDIIRQAKLNGPITYVLAWNPDGSIKDVSARYCHNFDTATKKLRVEETWLSRLLKPFKGKRTAKDILEDKQLTKMQLEKPLPQAISEYKNHPLYALKRHLLKFEGIYPPDAPPMGFIKNEPVYARECVYTLHSREIWLKSAKVVKLKETPYKVVTGRPKYNRSTGSMDPGQPLEIFGHWQTEDYVPPTAEEGVVPRNAYGNVELFKPCMLPKGTVHLKLPGLNKICRKLGIDCSQAITGFDFHGGSSHPVYDGFVVCAEFKETVEDAWHEDQQEQEVKEREKYEKRVYGNWKKLIKGLLIRRKLQNKYNFDNL